MSCYPCALGALGRRHRSALRPALYLALASLLSTACIDLADPDLDSEPYIANPATGIMDGTSCLGTLVNDRKTVVTASHCLRYDITGFKIRFYQGGQLLTKTYPLAANGKKQHPQYRRAGGHCYTFQGEPAKCENAWHRLFGVIPHDIGVVTLAEEVTEVEPMELPGEADMPYPGQSFYHVGNVGNQATETESGTIRFVGDSWMAFFEDDGTGNCFGDSGGSSYSENCTGTDCDDLFEDAIMGAASVGYGPWGEQILLGVHSSGICNRWGVDILVGSYADWIVPCYGRKSRDVCEKTSTCEWQYDCCARAGDYCWP